MHHLQSFQNYCFFNLIGGPKVVKVRVVVNFFKGFTFLYIVLLMYYFQNFSLSMYTYLALHGSYGAAWILKDIFFGDKNCQQHSTFPSLMALSVLLILYWVTPFLIASGFAIQEPTFSRIRLSVILYMVGVSAMIGADAQKTFTLEHQKGLISTDFFSRTRNPNYLAQMVLYLSFAIIGGHWISYGILALVWCSLFLLNILVKDFVSYRNKPNWTDYQQQSYILLPRIYRSHLVNSLILVMLIIIVLREYYRVN